MERLTERYDITPDGESDVWVKQHDYISAARKLCDYEDLEEQGLLVRLPDDLNRILYQVNYRWKCTEYGEENNKCETMIANVNVISGKNII